MSDESRYLDVPFQLAGSGRVATTGEDDHIRDMIFSVLFTSPGERVNQPDFGCGLKALVFAPASQAVAAATKTLVKGSLQKWLENEIRVEDVDVSVVDSSVIVKVVYVKRTGGERIVAELGASA
jgi:phage baseplate assembly protein W